MGGPAGPEMRGPAGPEMRGPAGPEEPKSLLKHFESSPYEASACQWLLMLDETPIYAIEPSGPFARETYDLLRQFLREQIEEGVERVSVPGVVAGTARLRSGATVPVLVPEARGMFSWTTEALVKSLTGAEPGKPEGEETRGATSRGVRNFLDRVYHQIRNTGHTPQERAINFVATYAFEVGMVFEQAIREEMELDTIEVTPSPIARPDSDCWDVSLTFFYPQRQVQTVRKVHRFTVDVLDVIPSMVSPPRSWFIR